MTVHRKPNNVLIVVIALLVVSGLIRMAMGIGPAVAYAEERAAAAPPIEPVEPEQELEPLLAAIKAREDRLAERELAIEDRLRALALAEEELTKRLTEVEEAETSLLAALALSETANDTDIGRLTAVYENMKPADAADLFEQMSPEFASGFLVRMRPDVAAAIFAGLEPQTAYSISAIIAGRNANAPTR